MAGIESIDLPGRQVPPGVYASPTAESGRNLAELVMAAKAAAPGAREELYRRLAPSVAAYLRSQGVDDVAGVANDVFVTVFSRLSRFSGSPAQFRSFVFTVAHARAVDEQRHRSRGRRAGEILPLTEATDPPAGDVEEDALAQLEAGDVARLLSRLTPDQRDVLLLRVVADLSVDETAAAMGKTAGAVRVLQHRALEALRRVLTAEAVER